MKSVIQNEHLTRQLDLIDIRTLSQKVVIIGCGAIGSFVSLALAKMGMTDITVFDFDTVDTVNMNGQFFRMKDIGTTKALALHNLVKDFTETEIKYNEVAFTEEHADVLKNAIVISAVDSMEVRTLIMNLSAKVGAYIIIDPRMSAEKYAQYAYPVDMFDKYVKTLYTDDEAVQEKCTAKATAYTALGAASIVTKTVKNILMGEVYPKQVQWDIRQSGQNTMTMFPNNMGSFVEAVEEDEDFADDMEQANQNEIDEADGTIETEDIMILDEYAANPLLDTTGPSNNTCSINKKPLEV